MTIFALEIVPNNLKRYIIMREIYLVYNIYYVIDEVNGDGKNPLWCCDSLDKAQANVDRLQNSFVMEKKKLNLNYDVKYGYEVLNIY